MAIPRPVKRSKPYPEVDEEAFIRVFDAGKEGRKVRHDATPWGPFCNLGRISEPKPIETLRESCPHRPVDWRWQRVQLAVDANQRIGQSENDVQMAIARRFLTLLWKNCKTESDLMVLPEREGPFESIFLALELKEANDSLTSVFQARLLTRASFADLSTRLGYSVEAITWYHDLFFDVRRRLDHPTYILHHAIGPQVHQLQEQDLGSYRMLLAYIGGQKVLDAIMMPFSGAFTDPEVVHFFRNEFRMLLRMRASIAARLVETTGSREAASFLRAWRKSEEMEARLRSRHDAETTDINRNVAAFFEELKRYHETSTGLSCDWLDSDPPEDLGPDRPDMAQSSFKTPYPEDPLLLD